ncbi:YolD-like family protein [Paenibacillus macquariensis]|uniref:YolD-like protein n=1 Tax=Paenibacillus macquariensis TaxID=948756 RepID=A0ABY1JXF0_9BACL|nr:YolD-like family protein [Paenibacillus macquariensis]MEC0089308.1 YolD-like family protein [Paenibacillus macquariensis]OAB33285.1 hypothetical protein PMSM_14835 [Paenibacillus macquariensis subsp. macquariensis]SIQ94098.1 YolD-like protein [Paenibacillus macquariensis]
MNAVPKPSGKKSTVSRPKRDDFELEELAEKIGEAKESSKRLRFVVWRNNDLIEGIVTELEPATQRVHIQTRDNGLLKILFIDILRADNIE